MYICRRVSNQLSSLNYYSCDFPARYMHGSQNLEQLFSFAVESTVDSEDLKMLTMSPDFRGTIEEIPTGLWTSLVPFRSHTFQISMITY